MKRKFLISLLAVVMVITAGIAIHSEVNAFDAEPSYIVAELPSCCAVIAADDFIGPVPFMNCGHCRHTTVNLCNQAHNGIRCGVPGWLGCC
ncbi:MAG: hypothetical protein FWB74_09960 [Defluviitaleaceae bacterium]|nr:hypothetical protein [Defluviitaleaceae bacterium]